MFTFPREIEYSTCVRMMNVKSMGIKREIFFSKKKRERESRTKMMDVRACGMNPERFKA
jgi:hypothetical protein